jgi:small subunit ribosomal protein S1
MSEIEKNLIEEEAEQNLNPVTESAQEAENQEVEIDPGVEDADVVLLEEELEEDDFIPEEDDEDEVDADVEEEDEVDVVQLLTATKLTGEEFDWDKYDAEQDGYSAEERSQMEAMFDQTLSVVGANEVIDGTVVFMNKREVVVNIGYKSEGVVSLNEFRYDPDLKIGDKVEVYVETLEDKNGQLVLSHKKARALRSWDRVNDAYEKSEIIKGYIKCRTKGGMIVDVFGIEAFLPGSQIDVKPIRDYDVFVGKTMEFKVVKINHEFKNVVVSHKALIEAELEIQKQEIISKLEKGQVLEGTVKNITSYGVFIDLGGVDGLIHITDLSWGRVNHPEEIVTLDQKINVVILDFDDHKKRIALGLKQLTPHPWDSLNADLKVGDVVKGKVVVMADYGAFVEITAGVEGLIHVSEMSWSQHLRSAQEFLKVGDEIEAAILTLDREDRKMSLGIKQMRQDPWANIETRYPINSQHTAKVRNFTGFGVFVEIEEGVDGLIHISDLSWTKKIKHPAEFCSIGDEISVVVLEIDKENRRLSLGHKQLEENPWDVFETMFSEGSMHEGTIISVFDRGAVIALPYGVEGFATPRHLIREDGTQAKAEEKLMFKVIEFNKSAKRIILSHSRVFEDEKRAEELAERKPKPVVEKVAKKPKTSMESTTLGDISELAALKDRMEADEQDVIKKGHAKKAAAMQAAIDAEPKSVEAPVAEVVEPIAEVVEPIAEVVEPIAEVVVPEIVAEVAATEDATPAENVEAPAKTRKKKEKTPEAEANTEVEA